MSAMDLHPEQLFDALRAGKLAAHERARLEAHCALCSACMFELRWLDCGTTSPDELTAEDYARGEAAFDNVLRSATRVKDTRALGAGRKPLRWGVAGLMVGASLGLLALFGRESWRPQQPRMPLPALAPNPSTPSVVDPVPTAPAPIAEGVESVEVRSVPQPSAAMPSANALLAAARSAQTRGQLERAQKLYRRVIDSYPSSDAAGVAHVALGRLTLELEAPRPALQLFEGYLRQHPTGKLAEEALYFRALSLEQLGRTRQAELGLRELLSAFPSSVYAAPARARLARGHSE